MFKKLRIKFIAIAMCSVFAVIFTIVCGINIANHIRITKSTDEIVQLLIDGDGQFSRPPFFQNPELPYKTRYFVVDFDSEGNVVFVNADNVAAVDIATAMKYATELYDENKANGFYGNYRYGICRTRFNTTRYVFVDCTSELDSFNHVLIASTITGAVGLLIIFLLILLLSGKIMKPVAESYYKQKRFITDAGHEIKTPLTIIGADTDIIEMQNGQSEWTTGIKTEVARLTSLTEKLIMLAKMDEGSQIIMTDFSLSDAVEETARSFSAVALSRGRMLNLSIEHSVTYHGNEELIRRLTSILIDNAIKYSDEDSEITVSLTQSGGKRLVVKNINEAFSAKDVDRIFDRFYRGDSSRSSETAGHGIGLALAKSIIAAHKGKITAKKTEDFVIFTVNF